MSFSSNQVRRTISGKSKQPTIATHSSNNNTTSSTFHNINNSNTIVTGSMTIADTIATTSSFDQQQHSAGRMISRSLSSEEKRNVEDTNSKGGSGGNGVGNGEQMKPLLVDKNDVDTMNNSHVNGDGIHSHGNGNGPGGVGSLDYFFARNCPSNPDFFKQAFKLSFAFLGLQISYLTWGYMQELIMTTAFHPTERVPDGRFPSAAFCVFSNRFLAVIIALIAVRIKHGAFFSNNKAPLSAFTPCALSNTLSSWSQYASLKYVSFPVQTVFKSSKIIPVMVMGKVLKGTQYPWKQYGEAALITAGVAIFSLLSKADKKSANTEMIGLIFLLMYVCFDSFTSQWQDKVYQQYGRKEVDPYQMMLGVNISAICITTAGLLVSGDLPIVYEFLSANPDVVTYNIITAITSASGQLCIFYTIKEFGPIVFTIIMTTRQMLSICLSAIIFGHVIAPGAACGALLVFGVLFYQIYEKYRSKNKK